MFFAFALIIIGFLLILEKLGIITGDVWGWIWPILILVLGVSLLMKKNVCCQPEEKKEKK